MAVNPIQNTDNKQYKYYLEAEGAVKTDNNVKPLPPDGHLVNDRIMQMPKFFFKDFAYDLKAVRDGYKGTANDHQSGRFNDTGLKLGGIGIATMLAARTTNPLMRIMEYAGLGAFLAAMSIYPKIAIQAPSRMLHGYDSGVEYIDDQGRKKSMFQDQNYIPYDMFEGNFSEDDLDIIGDRMGIDRDIHNRHGIIKEQMRKIAIQNNTLWMLTAGFATPVLAAIIGCGLEKLIAPPLSDIRNANANAKISHLLKQTNAMPLEISQISDNALSKRVQSMLSNYKGKELPKSEYNNLIKILTENLDSNLSEGIKDDLAGIFKSEGFNLGENGASKIQNLIKDNIQSRNRATLEKIFIPSETEINSILKDRKIIDSSNLYELKDEFKKLFESKINAETSVSKEYLKAYSNELIENITKSMRSDSLKHVSEEGINNTVNLAKILGEFKKNDSALMKAKSFKFEEAPETVIAKASAKFEKTLFNVLNITYKDLKIMKESETYTQEILDKKIKELVNDNTKYEKAVEKLSKVLEETETKLHGKNANSSHILDLINAFENNFNNTAKRLDNAGNSVFKNTIDRLVKQDVKDLSNSVSTVEDVYKLLDGTLKPENLEGIEYVKANAKGVGSSKNLAVSRIIERYQGANNSFNRVLHLLDIYKRKTPEDAYAKEAFERAKEAVMNATSSDHTLKLNTVNNPELYREIINQGYNKGIDEATGKALDSTKTQVPLKERFMSYLKRFRDIIGNNNIDFTKPEHLSGGVDLGREYTKSEQTRMAKFNLVAQSPVDLAKSAAERRYGTEKWLRRAGAIGGTVIAAAVIAQFAFGKIKNPHNLKKQVSDDTSN